MLQLTFDEPQKRSDSPAQRTEDDEPQNAPELPIGRFLKSKSPGGNWVILVVRQEAFFHFQSNSVFMDFDSDSMNRRPLSCQDSHCTVLPAETGCTRQTPKPL